MGHAPAKVDAKGRIKIPAIFRSTLEETYGSECFVTSFEGEKGLIYPMPVWREFMGRVSRVPQTSGAKRKLLERVAYFGQSASIDAQGRLLVPAILRDVADLNGEAVLLGSGDHLILWSSEKIAGRMSEESLTDDDFKELELHGV